MFKLLVCMVGIILLTVHINPETLAQSPADKPDENHLNFQFLEHLIKTQVDSVRKAHGLKPLINDSILYMAARDHAHYLSKEKEISHFQKNESKKKPQNRADFYGAVNYLVGENILSYPLENTYISTAQKMVQGWVNSPGHYKNIITPEYQVTGVAIARHPESGNFIAVQKFAKVLWKYTFRENKQLFKYSTDTMQVDVFKTQPFGSAVIKEKLPWQLQPLNFKKNQSCIKCAALLHGNYTIDRYIKQNQLYAVSNQADEILKTFTNKKDGLAVEIVAYEPYHCGNPAYYTNPARRNGHSSVDGKVYEPVYKKDLLKSLKQEKQSFKREKLQKIHQLRKNSTKAAKQELENVRKSQWEPGYWQAFIGDIPAKNTGYYGINFLLIHDGEIHLPLYYTSICGDLTFSDSLHMVTDFAKPDITIQPTNKKFSFAIPFKRNIVLPDTFALRAMEDSIRNYQIDTLQVEAFSSMEGFESLNVTLHKKRAYAIYEQLKPYADSNTVFRVQTKENWELFYKQLAHTAFSHWKDWETAKIKAALQQPEVLQVWENRLDEQRKARVTVSAHSLVRDTLAYVYKNYRIQYPSEAKLMQDYLYDLWQQQRISLDSILKIKYPTRKEYVALIANQLVLNYEINSRKWNRQEFIRYYHDLRDAAAIPKAGNILKYNYLIFVVNNWHYLQQENAIPAEKIYTLLKQVENTGGYGKELPRLKAHFFVKTLPSYAENKQIKRYKEGINAVFNFYSRQEQVLSGKEQAMQLAKYFVEVGSIKSAYAILANYLQQNAFDPKVYAYFLKTTFSHPFYQQQREYVKMLIEAKQLLPEEQWCDLFVGPCNITFQAFDDADLRDLYCKSCADRGNYATSGTR